MTAFAEGNARYNAASRLAPECDISTHATVAVHAGQRHSVFEWSNLPTRTVFQSLKLWHCWQSGPAGGLCVWSSWQLRAALREPQECPIHVFDFDRGAPARRHVLCVTTAVAGQALMFAFERVPPVSL